MIKRADEMHREIKPQMRGGDGQAVVTNLLDAGEYQGKSRMIATITLEPGCSIGEHVHEKEEEVFYIIQGTATYDDNGTETVLHPGDACICLGGQKHSIANRTADETLVLHAVILTY